MASSAAGRVGVAAQPVTTSASTSGEVVASWNGGQSVGMKTTITTLSSCWGQPRLVASSSAFFGVGVDRFAVRASNGSGPRTVASVVNEVAIDGSTNNNTSTKFETPAAKEKRASESSPSAASLFMADVANLIKLVDTRDIVELELKQKDYELIIRKKEALAPSPAPQHSSSQGPHVMAHTMFPAYQTQAPSPQQAMHDVAPALSTPAPAAAPAAVPDAIPLAAEHPPMLSPMAGTFYQCPGPGEPPYVKVGDKVTKGQVVCIVEAMKLMNEIEADQSGTIVEILAEDKKPVSMESALFVIKP